MAGEAEASASTGARGISLRPWDFAFLAITLATFPPRGTGYVVDSFVSAVTVNRLGSYEAVVKQAISLGHDTDTTAAIAGGLIAGGALGNLVDRLFRGDGWLHGRVIDFIDFQWFPIFNVADIGVDVGAGIFVVWSLVAGRHREVVGSTTDGGDA